MAILMKKLKGSTLVEVIVSMVIILSCLGIGMAIFSNISGSVNDELRILAEIRLKTWVTETKLKNDYTEATLEFENLRMERSILPYPKKARLKILFMEAFTPSGKKLTEYKEIIVVEGGK